MGATLSAVARMSGSEIRDRHSRLKIVPGFHGALSSGQPLRTGPVGSSGLQTKREAERRKAHPSMSAHRRQVDAVCATCPRAEAARCRGPLAFRRSTAALARATERSSSAQAALRAKERTPALPAPSIALKRSTPRPGRSAGGDDARAARERSYKLRPQEPHSLHRSAVAGDVPRSSEIRYPLHNRRRNVNENVTQGASCPALCRASTS